MSVPYSIISCEEGHERNIPLMGVKYTDTVLGKIFEM
jgi:hypothetical protein